MILYHRLAKRIGLFCVAAIVCLVPLIKYKNRHQQQDSYSIMENQLFGSDLDNNKMPVVPAISSNIIPIEPQPVGIVYVACGEQQIDDMFVSMKSVLLTTNSPEVVFVVFTDTSSNIEPIRERFNTLIASKPFARLGALDIYPVEMEFPTIRHSGHHHADLSNDISWKNLETKCGMQKLVLPALIEDFEAIIYLEPATVILRPIEELWTEFFRMRETEMLSLVLDSEPSELSVLRKEQDFDSKSLGSGYGVLLMNLTRMRIFEWEEKLLQMLHQHHIHLGSADPQNVLDAMVQISRKEIRPLSCQWNFRPFYCKKSQHFCDAATLKGLAMVNGHSGLFHQGNGVFSHLYSIYKNFDPSQMDIFQNVLKPTKKLLKSSDFAGNCGIIFSALANYMDDLLTRLYGAESFAAKGYYSGQHPVNDI